ncbi:hypothetical protein Tmar_1110 [Thermaerobacter marianensis DSM 12885]|uniref:Uncharacterized protein n=1 Tax=Thermaerobacter marianensis (strain ATCC 700841 / DSM 12885 / JCM 10246 / 7p75a) TaxID=644966 RepID=E6SKL5_THEM7|nr:DUF3189 family protein [Thermaerobacter marianensis]ADU51223.1 hypothetical protein Tmar_1110 [Thermaerobacter marianensis DSM 12885]
MVALTGTWLLALAVALLAVNALPGAHRLGLPPVRLAAWGLAWLAASVPVWSLGAETGLLAVSPGGAGVPLLATGLWLYRLHRAERRRAVAGLGLTALLAYALLRALPGSLPSWLSPAWSAGVITGVVASLVPLPAPAALLLATTGMVIGQGAWAWTLAAAGGLSGAPVPLHVTVAGGQGYEALAAGALTAAAMTLLGGDEPGGPAGGGRGPGGDGPSPAGKAPAPVAAVPPGAGGARGTADQPGRGTGASPPPTGHRAFATPPGPRGSTAPDAPTVPDGPTAPDGQRGAGGPRRLGTTGPPLVVYYCYGGTHASVVSAALHQGLLDPGRPPRARELANLDFFDRNETEEHGRLLPMGRAPHTGGLFVLGAEGAGDALARWCLGLLALAGDPAQWLYVNVLTEVNLAMKIAGFTSRRLGWRRLARPLLVHGVQAAFPHLVRRVEAARRMVAESTRRGRAGAIPPGGTAPPGLSPRAAWTRGFPGGSVPAALPHRGAVVYVAGGSPHRALVAAYLHLGRLDPRRRPHARELAALPLLHGLTPLDTGRLLRVGTDATGRAVLAVGAGGPDVLAIRAAHALRTLGYLDRLPGDSSGGGAPALRCVPVGESEPWWLRSWAWSLEAAAFVPGAPGGSRPFAAGFGHPGGGPSGGHRASHGASHRAHRQVAPPGRVPWQWRWAARAWTRRWSRLAGQVEAVRKAP